MSTVNVPDELLSRAQILADTEGISLEAFVVRCVDDAVTHMEAAEAELDAADDAATKKPAVPAGSAYAAVLNRQDGVGVSVTFEPDPPKAPTAYRRPMVYQSKSQVRRELKQFEQPIPHPSESAQAVLEGMEKNAAKKRRLDEEKEAERQANQRLLDECRRQAVEGMKARLGMDKG